MAQRSITSFFTKTPKKSLESAENSCTVQKITTKRERAESSGSDTNSPPEKKTVIKDENVISAKRKHIQSSDSDSPKKSRSPSPVSHEKKRTQKRQRIESSDSEPSISPKKVSPDKPKPKSNGTSSSKPERSDVDPKINSKTSKKEKAPSAKTTPKSVKKEKVTSPKTSPKTSKKEKAPSAKTTPKSVKKEKVTSPKTSPKSVKKEKVTSPKTSPKSVNENDVNSPLVVKDTNVKLYGSGEKAKEETKSVKKEIKDEAESKTGLLEKVTESSYNPLKSKYHPIEDACWSRGEKVPYLALAKTLEAIEATSARLKIVEILSNYLRSVVVLTPEDLLPSIYMCLNKLAPAYHSIELGVAETYLMKAIAQSTGRTLAQIKTESGKVGDLGLVAEQSRSTQRIMFRPAHLTVRGVFSALKEIAAMTGQASMNKKISKIQSMFVACRESEARYFIRSLAGKLRIGLAEQSVLLALGQATVTTPPGQSWPIEILDASRKIPADTFKAKVDAQALIIKTTYCECPNYDMIVPVLLEHGVEELPTHCKLTPAIPLKPMLAHPTKGIHEVFQRFENLQFTCEWKYDGERAQIHVPSDSEGRADLAKASIFSRNQENNTSKYPDVLGRLNAALKETVSSCVLDCEAVAWDREKKQILPFQILSTRKRKDASVEDIKVQVCLFMFDLLYLNGRALVREPLAERRRLLHEHFNVVEGEWMFATSKDCNTIDEVQEFLEESVKGSCEGLMVKTLAGKDATYEIAKRSRNWLKLKKDYLDGVGDTLDVVVIGGYHGRGKRTGVYGGFLLACYDAENEEYQSICKIGTGFSDEDLQRHSETLAEHKIEEARNYYRYDSSHSPDVWFAPAAVWEVRCADLSLSPAHRAAIGLVDPDKGISLRFPRFIRVRDDKTPEEATSAQQVAGIYLDQDQVKNQGSSAKNNEDDFY